MYTHTRTHTHYAHKNTHTHPHTHTHTQCLTREEACKAADALCMLGAQLSVVRQCKHTHTRTHIMYTNTRMHTHYVHTDTDTDTETRTHIYTQCLTREEACKATDALCMFGAQLPVVRQCKQPVLYLFRQPGI